MTMSILAVLISFAMMLTGVGADGQPAEAARSLVLHNVEITYNDETVALAPELRLGASTDGQKAVYDLGVDVNGQTLFPIQLGVDETGITALFENGDVAVNVPAEALNTLTEQANQMMQALQNQMASGQNPELMNFITQEFIPAYSGLIQAAQDPDFLTDLQAKSEGILAGIVDRGEGKVVTEEIQGQEYAMTSYSYTMNADQLARLADAVYTASEPLNNYYQAMFKLYSMMPEESGLRGLTSFKDLFEKTGLDMTMNVVEAVSEDGGIQVMDGTVTIDMTNMFANLVAQNTAAADAQNTAAADAQSSAPNIQIPPIVMNIHAMNVGESKVVDVSMDYKAQDAAIEMSVQGASDDGKHVDLSMDMELSQNDESIGDVQMLIHTGSAGGGETYDINYSIDIDQQDASFYFQANGIQKPDGTGRNSVNFDASSKQLTFGLSFDLDVVADAIEDKANGHEAALVLNDLSQEAMSAMGQDQAAQATLMQVVGSLMADSQKLMNDESVQKLVGLFSAINTQPVVGETEVYGASDGGEIEDYEYEEPVDDGVLGYEVPKFTWLPEGWTELESEVDTQYDWVNITCSAASSGDNMYATFYKDENNISDNYLVGDDGEIKAVDGREITVSDFGDGNVSVTLRHDDIYCNLSFFSKTIDVETIGKIVSGIQF